MTKKIQTEKEYKGVKSMRLDYVTYKTIMEIEDIEGFTDNELMEYLIEAVALAKRKGYHITPTEVSKDQRYKVLLNMFSMTRA